MEPGESWGLLSQQTWLSLADQPVSWWEGTGESYYCQLIGPQESPALLQPARATVSCPGIELGYYSVTITDTCCQLSPHIMHQCHQLFMQSCNEQALHYINSKCNKVYHWSINLKLNGEICMVNNWQAGVRTSGAALQKSADGQFRSTRLRAHWSLLL